MKNPFSIPVTPPEALSWDLWEKWHAEMRKLYPVRYFLSRTLPIVLSRLWKKYVETPRYWLRSHTIARYHLLDMRSPGNGYAWGWIDRSDAFLYANFALLVDFVEKEYPGCVDWDHAEEIRDIKDEFLSLYRWWTKERKQERDALDAPKITSPASTSSYADRVTALDRKDDEMLLRLLKVRHYLWT